MKKLFILLFVLTTTVCINAQVPYFAGTVGNNKTYAYTSLKVRPSINAQETYSVIQHGITDYFATGGDIYTGIGSAYMGFLVRAGYKFSKWLKIGAQVTPSFDLNDNFKFSYLTSALYMNGSITNDDKLFWCSNTWYGINKGSENTITQWTYLGYSFLLKNDDSINPMVGIISDWMFKNDIDIATGFYYTHNNWNFYLWGNDFLNNKPRVVAGVDFIF